jgi:hypothetical protein
VRRLNAFDSKIGGCSFFLPGREHGFGCAKGWDYLSRLREKIRFPCTFTTISNDVPSSQVCHISKYTHHPSSTFIPHTTYSALTCCDWPFPFTLAATRPRSCEISWGVAKHAWPLTVGSSLPSTAIASPIAAHLIFGCERNCCGGNPPLMINDNPLAISQAARESNFLRLCWRGRGRTGEEKGEGNKRKEGGAARFAHSSSCLLVASRAGIQGHLILCAFLCEHSHVFLPCLRKEGQSRNEGDRRESAQALSDWLRSDAP